MSRSKLTEGMRKGDLADLVLPLISVDEYESKISNKASVVFGWYVQDKDAANDLNRFIQKSAVSLLDTEVSPAPDQHGFFLVFVEFLDNDKLAENVKSILQDVSPLVDVDLDAWQMRVRKHKGLLPFSVDGLKEALAAARRTDESAILSYLIASDISDVRFDVDDVILEDRSGANRYAVVGFGNPETILQKAGCGDAPVALSIHEALRSNRLARMLGAGWVVDEIAGNFVLQREDSPLSALVIRP